MTPEIEKLNRTIITANRGSASSKTAAIEQMWDEVIKDMMLPNAIKYMESFPEDFQLSYKEEKCLLYFDGVISPDFGFKEGPSISSEYQTLQYEPDVGLATGACYSPKQIQE